MDEVAGILRCPVTHSPLVSDPATGRLRSSNGTAYDVFDDIGYFLEPVTSDTENRRTRAFYDEGGWSRDSSGLYEDTKRFVDTRPASLRFTRACMTRLKKYFKEGGQYLLDAGSGPIAHDELLQYSSNFKKRICLDLSAPALLEARRKLGGRGVYLQGDLTNLPIKSNTIDAVMSYHVIYQLPPSRQEAAFRELWRVLKPGGIAVIVYWWADPTLPKWIQRAANVLLGKMRQPAAEVAQPASANVPDHNPLSLQWFRTRNWPFKYRFDTYRVVGNGFLKSSIPSGWRGGTFLELLMVFQRLAPAYCGRHGLMPAIVIRKNETEEPPRYVLDKMRSV